MRLSRLSSLESWALAADNPYFGVTIWKADLRLVISRQGHLPSLWHPYLREAYEQTITITPNVSQDIKVEVHVHLGGPDANQMVESAYNRYTITEDVHSDRPHTGETELLTTKRCRQRGMLTMSIFSAPAQRSYLTRSL